MKLLGLTFLKAPQNCFEKGYRCLTTEGMQEASVRPGEWAQRKGVISLHNRLGITEGLRMRRSGCSAWYVNNNQHLCSSVSDTLSQASFLLLLYKKPGSYGGDASAWQFKHMDLTTGVRDSWESKPWEEGCAWLWAHYTTFVGANVSTKSQCTVVFPQTEHGLPPESQPPRVTED